MTQDPLAFQVFNEIGIIEHLSRTMFTGVLPSGMTVAQFTVLNHFIRLGHHERSPADLARAFQITRPTMTSTLTRMARAGLVDIRTDPADGRAKLVSVTPKGEAMRARCIAAIGPLVPLIDTAVSGAELAALLPALQKMRAALDALRDPPIRDA